MGKKYFDFHRKEDDYRVTVEASEICSITYDKGEGIIGLKELDGRIVAKHVDLTEEKYKEVSEYLTNK